MAWVFLIIAGVFEVGWAIGLKYTQGFTRLWPSVWTGVALVMSMWLLSVALKTLPVGTAYAVWVGIGAVGTVLLGIVLFGEAATPLRLGSAALIIAGVVGLKLAAP
jgi:quaternary ammonium compound-resistance protein SugE